jgi:hypothetical protein
MVLSFFEEIFPYDKFPVEYESFKQLKNDTDINYIAVPWTQILNSHWLNYPDKQPKEFYFKTLSKFKTNQKNNFTICQHDSYLLLELYYKHLNITKVFTPLRDKTERSIPGVEFLPIPFTNPFNFEQVEKDILFSFIGAWDSHPLRHRMRHRVVGDNIIYRDGYHVCTEMFFKDGIKEKEEQEYKQTLERSTFSLCPRGSSSSSVRFWESLHANAIPVLISDNWDLPDWDWNKTIIKIKESEFDNMSYSDIKALLSSFSENDIKTMKTNCFLASQQFNQNNFKKYIRSKI